jgi:hypothetical protein
MYDLLYMMDRDDIPVGVGGEGGISYDGTIFPDIGGYLSIIEQVLNESQYIDGKFQKEKWAYGSIQLVSGYVLLLLAICTQPHQ